MAPVESADEAVVLHVGLLGGVDASKFTERVQNDTEYHVELDDDHDDKE